MVFKFVILSCVLALVMGHTVHKKNILLTAEQMQKLINSNSRSLPMEVISFKAVPSTDVDERFHTSLTDFFQQERDVLTGDGWGECWANTEPKLTCIDGTEWEITMSGGVLSNWTKCGLRQGGRLLCPSTWPFMCNDHFCMQQAEQCYTHDRGHGGLRHCTHAPPNFTPTQSPTQAPTQAPTRSPTQAPTRAPTQAPTKAPTRSPTSAPTQAPTKAPTSAPTQTPTREPTLAPTGAPTSAPTQTPTRAPTLAPTGAPTRAPTSAPTQAPTESPTSTPTTLAPTKAPTGAPTTYKCWTNTEAKLKCVDGTEWEISKRGGVLSNWTKCGSREGGRLLCPSTWPHMCRDHFCMKKSRDCFTYQGGHGGLRPCPHTPYHVTEVPKDITIPTLQISTLAPTPTFRSSTLAPTPTFRSSTLAPTPTLRISTVAPTTPLRISTLAPTSAPYISTLVPTPTPSIPIISTKETKDIFLCGGITCEDVIIKFRNPCMTTWKEGCGTVPPPHGFNSTNTMYDMCPNVCSGQCIDLEWESSSSEGCDVYEKKKWCSDGTYGPGWKQHFFGNFSKWADNSGMDASHACCACGGGIKTAPIFTEKQVKINPMQEIKQSEISELPRVSKSKKNTIQRRKQQKVMTFGVIQ